MDEPVDAGGTGTSLSPQQTLAAALAGCTAMTLKMYSARKGWPLDDAQRERLLQIAGKCPVHRIVAGPNAFAERLVAPAAKE
jgi:putative redox protein